MSKSPKPEPIAKPSNRRVVFARVWLANGRNGAEAARSVGVPTKSATQTAARWLHDPQVLAIIAEEDARLVSQSRALTDKMALTAENLDRETARIALRDPKGLVGPGGSLLSPDELPEDLRRSIRSVKVSTDKDGTVNYSYSFEPKTESITTGYRRLGLLKDKVEVEVKSHAELVMAAFTMSAESQRAGSQVVDVTDSDETNDVIDRGGGGVGGVPKLAGASRKTEAPPREPWEK
jgi:hypothetical protein